MWEYMTIQKDPVWRVLDDEMTEVIEMGRRKGANRFRYEGVVIQLDNLLMTWPDTDGKAKLREIKSGKMTPKEPSINPPLKPEQCPEGGRLYTLVFPSFSTSIFQFPLDAAAAVATGEVRRFLSGYSKRNIKIVLLDRAENPAKKTTPTLLAFARLSPPDDRFEIRCGDVTKLSERGQAWMIANAANSRLYGGPHTGGINLAIHKAAGPQLGVDTNRLHGTSAKIGVAYPVPLSTESPLYSQGTRFIVHICGPNMNPQRPNCMTDIHKASQLLAQCYRSLFSSFAAHVEKDMRQ
eukprot:TRINITY_DN16021_c0_g1_i1.p1 TRINITY_DN16021_c0_g1~~TRINITY_DN16021_c0_g1_i1.p1  ORF type:complete len:294 (+),score=39.18 TRINITY_DN16021_c0_g1_i1:1047-1928(+)